MEERKVPNTASTENQVQHVPVKHLMVSVNEKGLQVSLEALTSAFQFHTERGTHDSR